MRCESPREKPRNERTIKQREPGETRKTPLRFDGSGKEKTEGQAKLKRKQAHCTRLPARCRIDATDADHLERRLPAPRLRRVLARRRIRTVTARSRQVA
jgi:hypothetical protein